MAVGPVREGPGPILPFGEDTCLAKIRWRPWQSVIPMLLGDHARRKLTEARAANAEEIVKGIAEEEEYLEKMNVSEEELNTAS